MSPSVIAITTAHADAAGLAGGRFAVPAWVVALVALLIVAAATALVVQRLRARKGRGS